MIMMVLILVSSATPEGGSTQTHWPLWAHHDNLLGGNTERLAGVACTLFLCPRFLGALATSAAAQEHLSRLP